MRRIQLSRSVSDAVVSSVVARTTRCIRTISSSTPRPLSLPALRRLQPLLSKPPTRYASTTSDLSPSQPLGKTSLFDLHVAHGAKMVPFGGYHMPVQYTPQSVSASHHFTRTACSLFDVGHMVQHRFSGPGVQEFLQKVTPMDVLGLGTHSGGLSVLLNAEGGIVDDTIITRLGPEAFYVVTNAGCREKDLEFLKKELEAFQAGGGDKVEWEVLNGWGLVALQGPKSEEVLEGILANVEEGNLKEMFFGQCKFVKVNLGGGKISSNVLVSRGGYTGEDGFEISIQPDETVAVTEALLSRGESVVQLAGLGARDSLRLEAGMCLYGHDLDETTTPVEAALSWVIGKQRKMEGGFNGADKILAQLKPKSKGGAGVERRRIGLVVEGAPAREGAEIVDAEGNKVGNVTSGCPSPTLGKNIAMAYIRDGFHKAGTEVEVVVRGKKRKATVSKMPFVPSKYWKGVAPA